MRLSRRGFTLIELLVVIGIILVLMSIIVIGFRHVNYTSATRETVGELHTCRGLLQEYENVNGRGNIEGPLTSTQTTSKVLPSTFQKVPVYLDKPVGDVTQDTTNTAIQLNDLGYNGQTDVGDKGQSQQVARYDSAAVQRTMDVMFLLLRDPKNRALVTAMPPKRILEGKALPQGGRVPNDIDHPVILDGWGNPIIYVPAGGLHVTILDQSSGNGNLRLEYIVRSTGMFPVGDIAKHPVTAADRPFWASAGQDGDFTKGEDNVYSFQD